MAEPARKLAAPIPETPAARLTTRLLPTGNRRMSRVMESGLSLRKSSILAIRLGNLASTGWRPRKRA